MQGTLHIGVSSPSSARTVAARQQRNAISLTRGSFSECDPLKKSLELVILPDRTDQSFEQRSKRLVCLAQQHRKALFEYAASE
jgi:hypothetical protein